MLCGHMKRVSQSANMCRQNRKSEGEAGRQDTADWLTLPRDAKVHQAVKCRKSKQAFNETKAQPPRLAMPYALSRRGDCANRVQPVCSGANDAKMRKENAKSQLISR